MLIQLALFPFIFVSGGIISSASLSVCQYIKMLSLCVCVCVCLADAPGWKEHVSLTLAGMVGHVWTCGHGNSVNAMKDSRANTVRNVRKMIQLGQFGWIGENWSKSVA